MNSAIRNRWNRDLFVQYFIGDSGNGAPDGYGAGGYYTVDPEGWPMIVVSAGFWTTAVTLKLPAPMSSTMRFKALWGPITSRERGVVLGSYGHMGQRSGLSRQYLLRVLLFSCVFYPHYPVNLITRTGQLRRLPIWVPFGHFFSVNM